MNTQQQAQFVFTKWYNYREENLNQDEALLILLSELHAISLNHGMLLESDAINQLILAFEQTVNTSGVPNSATIKAAAYGYISRMQIQS